jgi:hypothetical protein
MRWNLADAAAAFSTAPFFMPLLQQRQHALADPIRWREHDTLFMQNRSLCFVRRLSIRNFYGCLTCKGVHAVYVLCSGICRAEDAEVLSRALLNNTSPVLLRAPCLCRLIPIVGFVGCRKDRTKLHACLK